MPLRGEIVVECDSADCQAELVITALRAWEGLEFAIRDQEWKVYGSGTRTPRFICEQCTEEGK